MKNYFEQDLQKAHEFHGHICTGIIFGTRIARIGLNYLGIENPVENKDFIVFVEADRCIADAVSAVTGCSLGRRRLKWFDYGKMAATFVDMNTHEGIRIVTAAKQQAEDNDDLITFWSAIPDEELFRIEQVTVNLSQHDLPGRPLRRVLVGPSVPISPVLFNYGVDAIGSTVLLDQELVWKVVKQGGKMNIFKSGGQMVSIQR